jgi:hypothetical protein
MDTDSEKSTATDSEESTATATDSEESNATDSEESLVGGGGLESEAESVAVYSTLPIEYDLLKGERWERPMHNKSYKKIKMFDLKSSGIGNKVCSSRPSGFADAFDNDNLEAEVVKGDDGKECEYGCNPYKNKNKNKELVWK